MSKIIKYCFSDRQKGRSSLEEILEWDFDRIIISHGDIISTAGKEILRRHYSWLLNN